MSLDLVILAIEKLGKNNRREIELTCYPILFKFNKYHPNVIHGAFNMLQFAKSSRSASRASYFEFPIIFVKQMHYCVTTAESADDIASNSCV